MTGDAGAGDQILAAVDVVVVCCAGCAIVSVTGGAGRDLRPVCGEQVDGMCIPQRGTAAGGNVGDAVLVTGAAGAAGGKIPIGGDVDAAVAVTVNRTGAVGAVGGCAQSETERSVIESDIGIAVDVASADGTGGQCRGIVGGVAMTDLTAVALVQVGNMDRRVIAGAHVGGIVAVAGVAGGNRGAIFPDAGVVDGRYATAWPAVTVTVNGRASSTGGGVS